MPDASATRPTERGRVHPVIDPSYVPIIVALIGAGGVLGQIVSATIKRWEQVSGRKRTQSEVIAGLREALARARYLAIKAGVDPDDLPDDPTT